jgi:hypothetical protein
MTMRAAIVMMALAGVLGIARAGGAEPMFLSKQYPTCAACHYSPTGGGMLTDYGRSLSHVELSTFRASDPAEAERPDGEQAFLFGALGASTGDLRLGVALRPSHLEFRVPGVSSGRNLLMQADLQAAYQRGGLTAYASVGRHLEGSEASIGSYEHWLGYQAENGVGVRAGRFLPAYGVHFSDHTAFNRDGLELGTDDQVYGVEVSLTGERSILQVSLSPGRAESIVDDDGTGAFASAARIQFDVSPQVVVVGSGAFRAASDVRPRSGLAGVALGVSPVAGLSIWSQLDASMVEGPLQETAWVFVNETAYEVYPGVWAKISPQYRGDDGRGGGDVGRMVFGAAWLPRTHWNVNVSYFRDRNRLFGISTQTFLSQLHLFL